MAKTHNQWVKLTGTTLRSAPAAFPRRWAGSGYKENKVISIFEQGSGKGIGHSADSFLERFHEISVDHIKSGRAKALAFVFYDFHDREFKQILKDHGVFSQLDRLSGNDLSVFYLHSGSDRLLKMFNETLMDALGVNEKAHTPCVVFCRTSSDGFTDISVARLDSADLIHGFHELYGVISAYISGDKAQPEPKYISWVKGSFKFVSLESIKALIRELLKGGIL
ncbi:hypothetical protein [Microbulbifer thermotolerans]|uniref:hypothetical protein n=1 Tax=Microbulbifer thermotolerans TaxID=252514 RepID=UPI0012E7099E|nr:hypothetical protein [Microbulbifer thermotolerans]